MELDELKQTWQQSQSTKPLNTNIMELIQHKSYGPLAALKKSFRKQIALMMIVPAYVIIINTDDVMHVLSSVILWYYVLFCLGVIVFSYYNYQLVSKMEGMDNLVKSNLEQQIHLLEIRMKWKKTALAMALLGFILLLEIVPYFQHYRMLDKWHAVAPLIRYTGYVAFLVFQYFVSSWVNKRRYSRHLEYLKDLANELQ